MANPAMFSGRFIEVSHAFPSAYRQVTIVGQALQKASSPEVLVNPGLLR